MNKKQITAAILGTATLISSNAATAFADNVEDTKQVTETNENTTPVEKAEVVQKTPVEQQEDKVAEAKQNVDLSKQSKDEAAKAKQEAQKNVDAKQSEVDAAKNDVDKTKSEIDATIKQKQDEIDSMNPDKAVKEAEAKKDKAESNLNNVIAEKNKTQSDVDKLNVEKTIPDAMQEISDNKDKIHQKEEELGAKQAEIGKLQDRLTNAKKEQSDVIKEIDKTNKELEAMNNEIKSLNDQIDAKNNDTENKQSEINSLKDKAASLQKSIDETDEKLKSLNEKLNDLKQQLANANAEDAKKQEQIDKLNADIKLLTDTKNSTETLVNKAKSDLKSLESQLAAKEAVLNGTSIKEANDKLYDDFINKTFISNDGSYVKAEKKELAWYKALNTNIEKSGIDRKELGMYGFMGWLLENEYFDGMDKDFIMAHYKDRNFINMSSGWAAPDYKDVLTKKRDKGEVKLGDPQSATDAVNMMATFNEYAAYQKAMQNIIDQLKTEGVEAADNYTLKKFYIDPNAFMTTAITADLCTWGSYSHDGNAVAGSAECIAADAQFNGIRGITQWLQEYQYFQKAVDAGVCKWSDFFKEDGFHIPRAAAQYFKENNIQFVNYGHAKILTNALLQVEPSNDYGDNCFGAFGHGIMANIFQTASGTRTNGYYETKFVEKDGTLIRSIYDNIYSKPTGNLVGQGKEYEVDTLKNLFMRFLKEKGVLTDELANTYKSDVVDPSATRFDNLWTRMELDINRATGHDSYEKNLYKDCEPYYVNTAAIQDEVKTLKEQIAKVKSELEAKEKELKDTTDSIKSKSDEVDAIKATMGTKYISDAIDATNKEIADTNDSKAKLLAQLDKVNEVIEQLENAIKQNDADVAALTNKRDALVPQDIKNKLNELNDKLAIANGEISGIEFELKNANADVDAIGDEIQKLASEINDLSKHIAEIEKLNNKIAELEKQEASYNDEVKKALAEIQDAKDNREVMLQKMAELQDKLDKILSDYKNFQDIPDDVLESNTELGPKFVLLKAQMAKYQTLKNELVELQKVLADKTADFNKANELYKNAVKTYDAENAKLYAMLHPEVKPEAKPEIKQAATNKTTSTKSELPQTGDVTSVISIFSLAAAGAGLTSLNLKKKRKH